MLRPHFYTSTCAISPMSSQMREIHEIHIHRVAHFQHNSGVGMSWLPQVRGRQGSSLAWEGMQKIGEDLGTSFLCFYLLGGLENAGL